MGYLRPDFPKIFLASDWWRASSEKLRKIFGKGRKSIGKARRKKSREGWVGEGQKKEGRVGGARDDIIKKINK